MSAPGWWCWSARTAPARPISSRRSRCWRPGEACGARRSTRSPSPKATAPGRCPPTSKARSDWQRSAPASTRRRRRTPPSRKCRIDREPVPSATAFADHLRVIWLVPAMDTLFNGPASERRRFLDRLVLAVDAEHSSRVSALERALRSRNRLLEENRPDPHWLDAIEHETAELAVAVAALRAETVARLQAALTARATRRRCFRRPRSRSTAGWKRSSRTTQRSRWRIAIAPCSRTTARATPPPAARSTDPTSPISRSPMRPRTSRPPTPRPASRRRCSSASSSRMRACSPRCPASRRCCCSTRWSHISIRRGARRSTPSSKSSAPRSG